MSFERTSKGGIDQLTQDVSDLNLNHGQNGGWEEATKKKDGTHVARMWGPQSVVVDKGWAEPDTVQRAGNQGTDGSVQAPLDEWKNPSPVSGGVGSSHMNAVKDEGKENNSILDTTTDSEDGEDTDSSSDDDVYLFLSDGFDSDDCSHESRKNHRMLKVFFESLDKLTPDEIISPVRQWHCPVCQGGPGAICWFRGLKNLITHTRTKGSIRPRLHRGFLELLEEELHGKLGSMEPAGESYSRWEVLRKEGQDHDIVWPAMVVVNSTRLDKCDDKGMGVQELLDYFSSYAAVKSRHLYGPQGHLGISLLIFESSTVGYLEAERLHKRFLEKGTGREAWEHGCKLSCHGRGDQLYGYLATKDDVELFNQHSRGKAGKQRVKYELRSYSEVVSQLKLLSEDNQQLTSLKQKDAKEKRCLEKLEESLSFISEILRQGLDENHIVKQMSRLHQSLNQEQMNFQDQFFRDEKRYVQGAVNAKKDNIEKVEQEEKKKVEDLGLCVSSEEDHKCRLEEMDSTIKSQDLEKPPFVMERNNLVKAHEGRRYECMKRCLDELMETEKGFDAALDVLKGKHASGSTGGDTSSASIL